MVRRHEESTPAEVPESSSQPLGIHIAAPIANLDVQESIVGSNFDNISQKSSSDAHEKSESNLSQSNNCSLVDQYNV